MNLTTRIADTFVDIASSFKMQEYIAKYGTQLGKTAKNGSMAFIKLCKKGKKIITGVDKNGSIISTIKRIGDGSKTDDLVIKTIFDKGQAVKIYNTKIATDYRRTIVWDILSAETKTNIWTKAGGVKLSNMQPI